MVTVLILVPGGLQNGSFKPLTSHRTGSAMVQCSLALFLFLQYLPVRSPSAPNRQNLLDETYHWQDRWFEQRGSCSCSCSPVRVQCQEKNVRTKMKRKTTVIVKTSSYMTQKETMNQNTGIKKVLNVSKMNLFDMILKKG